MRSILTKQITRELFLGGIHVRIISGIDLPTEIPQEDVDVLASLQNYAYSWERVGSTVTCNPPPVATDIDVLIHTNARKTFEKVLEANDFKSEGGSGIGKDAGYPDDFLSYRKGMLNLIITTKRPFYVKFMRATYLCKRLNLIRKDDRIAVFRAILYGD